MQTYYKLSYVDGRISNPEHRLCEDIPRFCDGLAEIVREWANCSVDAAVFAYLLRSYSRTHKYTLAIAAYVFGAGIMTTVFAPNFGRLFGRQQENEGVVTRMGLSCSPAIWSCLLSSCELLLLCPQVLLTELCCCQHN